MSDLIIVRSLTDSDLGLFAAHRAVARSKQRAIALTSEAASMLLSPRLYEARDALIDTICVYRGFGNREQRRVGKVGKNWRLGGRQLVGPEFAELDSRDFVLIRSVSHNDGDAPILVTFVGRHREQLMHAGLAASIGDLIRHSVVIVPQSSKSFDAVAAAFPPVPPSLALAVPPDQTAMI